VPATALRGTRTVPNTAAAPSTRADLSAGALAAGLTVLCLVHSWALLNALRFVGFDLGIFTQAVRSYAETGVPTSRIKGDPIHLGTMNLLGDHFHPIIAVIAPLYRLFPTAYTLLAVQAVLIGLSVFQVGRYAARRLGGPAGPVVGACHGLSYGVLAAVGFEFHEVAFAVPLLAGALIAVLDGRERAAVLWSAPLVLVKEDLGLTVAAIGVALVLRRRSRSGAALIAGGVLATWLTMTVVVPALNSGTYAYTGAADGGGPLPSLLGLPACLVDDPVKRHTLLLMLLGCGIVGLRSPVAVVALPTVLWRLTAAKEAYWGTAHHYDLLLMPVLVLALVDGAGRTLERGTPRTLRQRRAVAVAAVALCAGTMAASLPAARLGEDPALLRAGPDASSAAALRLARRIPDGGSVATRAKLAPVLVPRCAVWLLGNGSTRIAGGRTPGTEWILTDRNMSLARAFTDAERDAVLSRWEHHGLRVVAQDHGWFLLHRV